MKEDFQKQFDQETEGFETWEIKLLDEGNQPELYDTLEVLKARDNINFVANAVIVVYVFLGLLNVQFIRMLLQGNSISLSEVFQSLSNDVFTILSIGLQIAIIYFPLKALGHILRILMEMEFNSRKA